MSINANTSVLEYERLTAERTHARLARKAINKRRYLRHYARVSDRREGIYNNVRFNYPVRVSDIVTVTIGPLFAVTYLIDALGLV